MTATLETPPARSRWTARRTRLAGLATGAALAVAATVWFTAPGPETPAPAPVPADWARPVVDDAGLAQRSGVEITRVAVTGGGGLVDLRFRVVDPAAAASVHDPAHPPAIVDEHSGLVVHDLFMGHSHSGTFKAGVTYYFVFSDPVNWVRQGSQVTVLLGNAQVEHVAVR